MTDPSPLHWDIQDKYHNTCVEHSKGFPILFAPTETSTRRDSSGVQYSDGCSKHDHERYANDSDNDISAVMVTPQVPCGRWQGERERRGKERVMGTRVGGDE